MSDNTEIVVARSTPEDLPAWLRLASEVEPEFGAPMADSEKWIGRLNGRIEAGAAWSARPTRDGPFAGGMWLERKDPDAIAISWLAVGRAHRRRGLARTMVRVALAEAAGRPVNVVTFGDGHPMAAAADAARALYVNLGFEPASYRPPDGPDGTPRAAFRHANET